MAYNESTELRDIETEDCRQNKMKDVSVQTEIEIELSELRQENSKLRKELEEAKNSNEVKKMLFALISKDTKTLARISSSSLALAVTTCFSCAMNK